ncbi:MAG: biopolymer transporter ExbD [Pseudomonadota bacterium]|nr:biopolymer transporter ExbD [Pseudomonadota bacterium]
MSTIITPGRRPAYAPIGRLRSSPLSGGKKSGFASLNLTAMVDMFTILVIFLIQLFTASGEVTLNDRIKVPKSVAGTLLEEPGTVILMDDDGTILLDSMAIPEAEMGTELDIVIPGMSKRLKDRREYDESIKTRAGIPRDPTLPYDGIIIIQADIKTDFRNVRRVLASANDAGWAKIKFVTIPAKAIDPNAPAEGAAPPPAAAG